ncbi:MAG TPA: GNAT family N-acetyltransferase [Rhodocyclaceae bacterium]|nr:GNAT family N-acetyltransferase [Rhodocyclaceae bacterium]HNB79583.1 GNAT family N-acetyltransferase [Rhodocyclaceae bacterium]
MHPPETFDTERCLLRRPRPADAEAMFAAFGQDAEVNRYLGWKSHESVADTRRQITHDTHRWDRGAAWAWLVELRADASIVGFLQLQARGHQAHLGFLLARSHWGRGLMAEAAEPVVRDMLDVPHIYRIDAVCDVDNPASARVLEKLGMQLEGRLRRYMEHPNLSGEPRDVLMYSIVR